MNDREFENIAKEEKSKLAKTTLKEMFTPISLNELFSKKFPKNKWVVERLVPLEGITIISAAPASYKTWLLLKMAISISQGVSLFGQFKCKQSNVLIIDEENHMRLLKDRMNILGAKNDLNIHFMSQKGFMVSSKEIFEIVIDLCKERNIGVVFIDSLVRINEADENSASEMSKVFRDIKKFCLSGITVVVTHHDRKEGRQKLSAQKKLRGSGDIQASVDCHLAITRDANNRNRITIEQAKLRDEPEIEPFTLEISENDAGKTDFVYLGSFSGKISQKDLAARFVKLILKESKCELTISELKVKIKKQHGIGDKNTADAIKELADKKVVLLRKGEKNAKICSLNESPRVIVQKTLI